MGERSKSLRLSIYGSCVSRDALNLVRNYEVELVDYYARSSFGSLFHPIPVDVDFFSSLTSPFQKRLVEADLKKSSVGSIVNGDYDLLLIDLIDERFPLYAVDGGGLFTVSNEVRSGGFSLEKPSVPGRVIDSGSSEFFEIWLTGWRRFVEIMVSAGRLDRVVVNRTHWASGTSGGVLFSRFRVPERNEFLDRMYREIEVSIPIDQFIDYPKRVLLGSDSHKWGRSPFHYVDEFYAVTVGGLFRQANRIGVFCDEA